MEKGRAIIGWEENPERKKKDKDGKRRQMEERKRYNIATVGRNPP